MSPKSGGPNWGVIILGVLLLAMSGVVYAAGQNWVERMKKGPTTITTAQLLEMGQGKEPPSRWVRYTATGNLVKTDVRLVSSRSGTVANYVMVPVGSRFIIARVPPHHSGRNLEGTLEVWKEGKNLEAIRAVQLNLDKSSGRLLQFQLDGTDDPMGSVRAYYLAIIVLAVIGVALVPAGMFFTSTKEQEPIPDFSLPNSREQATWQKR